MNFLEEWWSPKIVSLNYSTKNSSWGHFDFILFIYYRTIVCIYLNMSIHLFTSFLVLIFDSNHRTCVTIKVCPGIAQPTNAPSIWSGAYTFCTLTWVALFGSRSDSGRLQIVYKFLLIIWKLNLGLIVEPQWLRRLFGTKHWELHKHKDTSNQQQKSSDVFKADTVTFFIGRSPILLLLTMEISTNERLISYLNSSTLVFLCQSFSNALSSGWMRSPDQTRTSEDRSEATSSMWTPSGIFLPRAATRACNGAWSEKNWIWWCSFLGDSTAKETDLMALGCDGIYADHLAAGARASDAKERRSDPHRHPVVLGELIDTIHDQVWPKSVHEIVLEVGRSIYLT